MLVNVSRYKNVQRQVFDLLAERWRAMRTAIELHHADRGTHPLGDPTLSGSASRRSTPTRRVTWDEVLAALAGRPFRTSASAVQLRHEDRELEARTCTWDRPPRMIAVGGDVLSRGLTLEGLTRQLLLPHA